MQKDNHQIMEELRREEGHPTLQDFCVHGLAKPGERCTVCGVIVPEPHPPYPCGPHCDEMCWK